MHFLHMKKEEPHKDNFYKWDLTDSASYIFNRHTHYSVRTEKSVVINRIGMITDSIRTSQDNYRMRNALQLALGPHIVASRVSKWVNHTGETVGNPATLSLGFVTI